MQTIVDGIKLIDLKSTVSKYEKDGYTVSGITYVSKDDTYLIVFYKKDIINKPVDKKTNEEILKLPYNQPYTPTVPNNPTTPWTFPVIYCKDSISTTSDINVTYN